jgi:hypothetical protein
MSPAEQKQHAHELVERLDAGQLDAVVRLLEVMIDPVARRLARRLSFAPSIKVPPFVFSRPSLDISKPARVMSSAFRVLSRQSFGCGSATTGSAFMIKAR